MAPIPPPFQGLKQGPVFRPNSGALSSDPRWCTLGDRRHLLEVLNPVYVFAGNATLNIITGILFLYAFNAGHKNQPVPLAEPEDRFG
jgi:hypothetical protein